VQQLSEHRWLLALLIAGGIVLPVELHSRHGARPGAVIVAWLIYAAIVRLIIFIVDRAPEGNTRRPSPTNRSQTWTVRYGVLALVAVIVLVLGLAGVKSLVGWSWPEATKGSLAIDALFLLALVPLYRSGRLGWADLGIRILPRKLAVGLFLLGLAAIVVFNVTWRTIVSLPRIEDGLAGLPHRSALTIVLTGVALCLAAPVVEEIFFRGLLYRTLRNRLAVLPAALLVGILFGLGHSQYPLLERPQQAAFGFIACLVYERCGSLLPCIAMHMFIDSYAFTFALTGLAWIVPSVFLLVGLVVLYGAPLAARLARPLGRARPRTA
jgi:membrane protease YdiL (CAAX protease family)